MIDNFVDLIKFTREMRDVQRAIHATVGEDRAENLAEHSFQLAIASWYIAQKEGLVLDMQKIFLYSLLHDAVEVYAGDTNAHDTQGQKKKQELEAEAVEKIKKRFDADFPELGRLLENYEEKSDEESKFVYAVDKILPIVNAYIDPRFWIEMQPGVTPEQAFGYTAPKAKSHPVAAKYYDELEKRILENRDTYFNSDGEKRSKLF